MLSLPIRNAEFAALSNDENPQKIALECSSRRRDGAGHIHAQRRGRREFGRPPKGLWHVGWIGANMLEKRFGRSIWTSCLVGV